MCANARNKSQHVGSLDENTKDSGTQIPTIPYIPLFGARAPAQHCWMCCANERNIVGPRFDDPTMLRLAQQCCERLHGP